MTRIEYDLLRDQRPELKLPSYISARLMGRCRPEDFPDRSTLENLRAVQILTENDGHWMSLLALPELPTKDPT